MTPDRPEPDGDGAASPGRIAVAVVALLVAGVVVALALWNHEDQGSSDALDRTGEVDGGGEGVVIDRPGSTGGGREAKGDGTHRTTTPDGTDGSSGGRPSRRGGGGSSSGGGGEGGGSEEGGGNDRPSRRPSGDPDDPDPTTTAGRPRRTTTSTPRTTRPPTTQRPPTTRPPTTTTKPPAHAPKAVDDARTVRVGSRTDIAVTANDRDADDDLRPSSLRIVSGPGQGTAEVQGGEVRYQAPLLALQPTTSVTYEVCDAGGRCDRATLTITIRLL